MDNLKHRPFRRNDFLPLASFIKERYEPARKWGDEKLLDYICWSADNDFLFIARDNNDTIIGAALARPVADIPKEEVEFDHGGDIIFIDVMVTASEKAFLLLGVTILDKFNDCNAVAFTRLKRGDAVKLYSYNHVRQTLFKLRKKLIYG